MSREFYRAHLAAPVGIDLTTAGTFFETKRVGFKNLDPQRIANAKAKGAKQVTVRGLDAYRLPVAMQQQRVGKLVRAIGRLEGGAKQTLHLTDTSPAVLVLAVCRSGHQPFLRPFAEGDRGTTIVRVDVLKEVLRVFRQELLSNVYLGWATGFLDDERKKVEALSEDDRQGCTIHLGHPREMADAFAAELMKNPGWFD